MSLINTKQEGKLLFIFRPEAPIISSEKYKADQNENDLNDEDKELTDDDENDINGDDTENTNIYEARIFYLTHRESSSEVDPAYK